MFRYDGIIRAIYAPNCGGPFELGKEFTTFCMKQEADIRWWHFISQLRKVDWVIDEMRDALIAEDGIRLLYRLVNTKKIETYKVADMLRLANELVDYGYLIDLDNEYVEYYVDDPGITVGSAYIGTLCRVGRMYFTDLFTNWQEIFFDGHKTLGEVIDDEDLDDAITDESQPITNHLVPF